MRLKNSALNIILALLTTAFIASNSNAEPLSNVALFNRCYSQLTQLRPSFNDPLTVAVRNGSRTPISACMEVLDRARFVNAGNTQVNSNDPTGLRVLENLHKFHASWFTNKDITEIANEEPTRDIYDVTVPALYYTRALFGSNILFDSVVTSTETIRPVRTENAPTRGPSSARDITASVFYGNAEFKFAGTGSLLGYESPGLLTMNYNSPNGGQNSVGTINLGQHFGGGLLGHPAYLVGNVKQEANFRADGALLVPRKFAREIMADLLCRDIPVVRESDISGFVVPTSSVPFRTASGCVTCHATIDRMAGVIRGFNYLNVARNLSTDGFPTNIMGVTFPRFTAVDQGPETGWPSEPDSNYHRRPTNGVLFFRNIHGTLINIPINSLHDLGTKLADQEDLHICAAKRYYQYFTGIDAFVGDVTDPYGGVTLSATDQAHRNQVIALGRNLKNHQSLRLLIQEILNLPIYRESNFGVTN